MQYVRIYVSVCTDFVGLSSYKQLDFSVVVMFGFVVGFLCVLFRATPAHSSIIIKKKNFNSSAVVHDTSGN